MSFQAVTIKQLRAFKAYVDTGSIAAAAEKLNVTPPAITIQIKALEALAGASLVRRIDKIVSPTDTGKRVLALATSVALNITQASDDLENIRYARMGTVRLGVVSTAKYFIPNAIAGFRNLHPGVDVSLLVGNRSTIIAELERGRIDLAIAGRPTGKFASASTHLCAHPYVVVSAKDNHLATRTNLTLSDLHDHPFLVRETGSGSRALMETVFTEEGLAYPRIGLEADSNETIKQGVMAGLGIAFISAHTVHEELQTGRLAMLNVSGFPVVRAWYVVENPSLSVSSATLALREYLTKNTDSFVPVSEQILPRRK